MSALPGAPAGGAPAGGAPAAEAKVVAEAKAVAEKAAPTSLISTIVWCIVAVVIIVGLVVGFFWNRSLSNTNAEAIGGIKDTMATKTDMANLGTNIVKVLGERIDAVKTDANTDLVKLGKDMDAKMAEMMKPSPVPPERAELTRWDPRYSIVGDLLTMTGEDIEASEEARHNLSLGGKDFGPALVRALDSRDSRVRRGAKEALRARAPRDNDLLAEVARNPRSSGSARAAAEEILSERDRTWQAIKGHDGAIQKLGAGAEMDRSRTAAEIGRLDRSQAESRAELAQLTRSLAEAKAKLADMEASLWSPAGDITMMAAYIRSLQEKISALERMHIEPAR